MDKKYGVYICTGCGIGEALEVDALCGIPEEEGVPVKTHPFLCSQEGVELIKQDMENEGINTMVIAGCSRRVNAETFTFENCLVERVNLREQVIWSHPRSEFPALTEEEKEDEENYDSVQMLAEDYLRMGMARLENIDIPEPYELESLSKRILVIGGGVTGMTAALNAARTGYEVTLVEKEDALGGFAAKMRKQMPTAAPYDSLVQSVVPDLIKSVEAEGNITVKTETQVARIAGQPGDFTVTLKKPGEKHSFDVPYPLPEEMKYDEKGNELDAEKQYELLQQYNEGREDILTFDPEGEKFGAVVLAAGWRPYKLAGEDFAHLGIGEYPDVVTNTQFEEMAGQGRIVRPSDGKEAKSVVFIQSPGKTEDDRDFEYCSSVTSMAALKQAKYVRDDYPDGKAYILYQHMRTPGLSEYFYKALQEDPGVFMSRGDVTGVAKQGQQLAVEAENTLLGEKLKVKADMVVLSSGMVPATFDDPVVNLAYRQGPGFRDNDIFNQYADSNFICFPYETQRTGVYAAGTIRRSLTIEDSMDDAAGAALKAIQCIESSNRGVSVHPRSWDMTYPDFFFQRCTGCKRCTDECPFGALDDDAKGVPKPNPTRCRRCGTCMGACPERIIGFADYNINSVGSMVKSIEVPSEDDYDEPPLRILALVCENDAYPA
ncbi:MAG: CoB--CoM heterodisulfide reductase iron-sulfur subunit A family protein, partial [Desulfobacterales bacterium]|nr:CoB--CoM heterodisulfide reductase iron-sulfur subunit A family protein [Desulfobacterales bacterium]